MKQLLKDLRALRRLLTPRKRWTKNIYARRIDRSFCFCIMGGIRKVAGATVTKSPDSMSGIRFGDWDGPRHDAMMNALEKKGRVKDLVDYNDNRRRTHDQVLALIDRTIKRVANANA